MLVKKFKAGTFEEALHEVKREMGPKAVILSRKVVKNPDKSALSLFTKPYVELTAAIDRRLKPGTNNAPAHSMQDAPAQKRNIRPSKAPGGLGAQINDMVSFSSTAKAIENVKPKPIRRLSKRYVDITDEDTAEDLSKKKVEELQNNLSNNNSRKRSRKLGLFTSPQKASESSSFEMEEERAQPATPKALKSLCLNLTLSGIDSKLIHELVESVTDNMNPLLIKRDSYLEGFTAKFFMDRMKISGGIKLYNDSPNVVLVMGSPGVGKTTTVAKLASEYKNQGKRVGIVTIDVFKIGAVEQLKVFSNILGIPLRVASTGEELPEIITQMKDFDLILIDSAGRSKKDNEAIADMKNILNINVPVEKHLCLSASMREEDALATYKRFSTVGIDRILFTKLDETSVHGGMFNVSYKTNTPISYFSTGQRVPEDVEVATKERMVDLILKLSSN